MSGLVPLPTGPQRSASASKKVNYKLKHAKPLSTNECPSICADFRDGESSLWRSEEVSFVSLLYLGPRARLTKLTRSLILDSDIERCLPPSPREATVKLDGAVPKATFCRFPLGVIVSHLAHCEPGFPVVTHAYGRARYPLEEE